MNLLHFNFSAGFNQLLLGFFGFFLGHGFLQGGGSAVNLVLGFLQAEAGQSADNLDDADLVGAGGLQDDVEFGLFFSGSSGFSGAATIMAAAERQRTRRTFLRVP